MLGKWACLYSLITLWVPVSNGRLFAQNTVPLDKSELIEVESLRILATALLEFSVAVRGGALKTIRAFLADEAGTRSWVKGSGRLQAQQEEGS